MNGLKIAAALVAPALVAIAVAAPAFAEPSCAASANPKPVWEMAKAFEESGGSILSLKMNDGCVEIYGKVGGDKVEVFFDPESGKELERE